MSMTQKEIKELIASGEKMLKDAQEGYKNLPEHKQVKLELEELEKKRAHLQKEMIQIEVKYREDNRDKINFAHDELKYFNELLRKHQDGLNPNDYNDELIKMFNEFVAGTDGKKHRKLQWVSEDGKYALFKRSSYSGYGDRFSKNGNVPAVWALVKIVKKFDPQALRYFMGSIGDREKEIIIWAHEGGRWSNYLQKQIEHVIFEHENK